LLLVLKPSFIFKPLLWRLGEKRSELPPIFRVVRRRSLSTRQIDLF